MDNGIGAADGKVAAAEFLAHLKTTVTAMADQVLARIGQTSADCPYIPRWFDYYEHQSATHLESVLAHYAPSALEAPTWQGCAEIVAEKIRRGLEDNVSSGSLDRFPADAPREVVFRATRLQRMIQPLNVQRAELTSRVDFQLGTWKSGLLIRRRGDDLGNLPDWGNAVTVGYKSKPRTWWDALKQRGHLDPADIGGGVLGNGFYTTTPENKGLADLYANIGQDKVTVEVGYLGDQSAWVRNILAGKGAYNAADEGLFDTFEIPGPVLGQICFKTNGPHPINTANFRFRLAGTN